MPDDPKQPPHQVHRFDSPKTAWEPDPLPILPDERKRRSLSRKIEAARRKAVDMDVIYLLDEFTRTLQCLNMAARGVTDIPDTPVTDIPENVTNVTNIIPQTDPSQKQATPSRGRGRPAAETSMSPAERARQYRKRKAEQALKGSE